MPNIIDYLGPRWHLGRGRRRHTDERSEIKGKKERNLQGDKQPDVLQGSDGPEEYTGHTIDYN